MMCTWFDLLQIPSAATSPFYKTVTCHPTTIPIGNITVVVVGDFIWEEGMPLTAEGFLLPCSRLSCILLMEVSSNEERL